MHFHPVTAILIVCCLSAPAFAAYSPPVQPQALPDGALVRVNRRTVLVVRRSSGSTPPEVRASLVSERLTTAIQRGLAPAAVQVRRIGRQFAVFVGSTELIRPTRADARQARTTPRRLAYRWEMTLRQTLALPPLTLSARALLVPFGESRALRVGGVAGGSLALSPRDPQVATAEIAGDGRSVRVRAGQPGATVLAIAADGATTGVPVVVKKYAGEAGEPVTVDCTGRPAPAELVRQLVMESYPRALRLEPGAGARPAGKARLPGAIVAGKAELDLCPAQEKAAPGGLPRRRYPWPDAGRRLRRPV
jgi:hypothetical protein